MEIFSLRDVANILHVNPWRISFLFESGKLEETPRFAGKRIFSKEDISKIADLLGVHNVAIKDVEK